MRLFGELTATDAAVLNQALKECGGALPAGAKSDPVAVTANKQPTWSNPTSAKHNAAALMAVFAQALAAGMGSRRSRCLWCMWMWRSLWGVRPNGQSVAWYVPDAADRWPRSAL